MGKTRLAAEALTQANGVWCDASTATDAGELLGAVGTALDVVLAETVDAAGAASVLAPALEAAGLVVLDNLEQVEDADEAVAALLSATPSCRFVCTSRRVLGHPSERVLEVAPLDDDAAVALFLDRATGLSRSPTVETLVRALDGLPLAIELAAARSRASSPKSTLASLDKRLKSLRSDDSTGRHGSVRQTIDWSYSLLSPSAQCALAHLGAFAGPCSIDAFELVVPDHIDASTALLELERAAMVRLEDRAWTCLESVRAYAREALDAADWTTAAWRRHANAYLTDVDTWLLEPVGQVRLDERRHLTHIAPELAIIVTRWHDSEPLWAARAAIRLSLFAHDTWDRTRQQALGRRGLTAAISAGARNEQAILNARLGWVERNAGDHGRARELRQRGRDLAAADSPVRGRIALDLAVLMMESGGPRSTISVLEAVLERDRMHHNPLVAAEAYRILGYAHNEIQQPARAEASLLHAVRLYEELGAWAGLGHAHRHLASLRRLQDRIDDALDHAEQALAWMRRTEIGPAIELALTSLALVERQLGRLDAAHAHIEEGLQMAARRGAHLRVANQRLNLGMVMLDAGKLERAIPALEEVRMACMNRGALIIAHAAAAYQSIAWLELGDLVRARAGLEPVWEPLEDQELLGWLAVIDVLEGDLPAADGRFTLIDRQNEEEDYERGRHIAAVQRAVLDHEKGDEATAQRRLEQAEDRIRSRTSNPDLRVAVRIVRGLVGSSPALRIEGGVVHLPDRSTVNLSRRRAPRAIFEHLVRHRSTHPGASVSAADLIDVGWPGERIMPAAATNRLYVAMATLRKLGLGDVIETDDGGYRVPPAVEVQ
jgi:predicted ATPase